MSDPDTRLERALAAEAPAARDPLFRVQVLIRRERAAARRRLLSATGQALGVAVVSAAALVLVIKSAEPGPVRLALICAAGAAAGIVLAAACLNPLAALRAGTRHWLNAAARLWG